MTCGKIRRSGRCVRTQPPRLVHAVQRSVQLSVTNNVTQITVNGAFDWAFDISAPHMMQAAFPAAVAARRVRNPGERRSRTGRATSGWLGARHHSVTTARSARSPGARATPAGPSSEPHTGSWRATRPVCGLWTPIVMPLSSPRYIPRTRVLREPGRGPVKRDVDRCRGRHRVTSSSCAPRTPFPSGSGGVGHQFQFRIRALLPDVIAVRPSIRPHIHGPSSRPPFRGSTSAPFTRCVPGAFRFARRRRDRRISTRAAAGGGSAAPRCGATGRGRSARPGPRRYRDHSQGPGAHRLSAFSRPHRPVTRPSSRGYHPSRWESSRG